MFRSIEEFVGMLQNGLEYQLKPPYTKDAALERRYIDCVRRLASLRDRGWLTLSAKPPDVPFEYHDIVIEWQDEVCDMGGDEIAVLKDFLSLSDDICVAEQGKVWVVSIHIYQEIHPDE